MDYAVPRADMLPLFRTEISEVPSTTNPLGMRAAITYAKFRKELLRIDG